MPNKYPRKKGWKLPKQKYKVSNWAEYNQALRNRGDIEFWVNDSVVEQWWVILHKRRNILFATLSHLQSQYPSQIKERFVRRFLPKIELAMQIHMAPRQY